MADQGNPRRRYRELANELARIGPITPGSVVERWTRCANPGCGCRTDPPQLHGPYWQWTTKKNGKTTTRRLTAEQARTYREWVNNDRRLRTIIDEMRTITQQSADTLTHSAKV